MFGHKNLDLDLVPDPDSQKSGFRSETLLFRVKSGLIRALLNFGVVNTYRVSNRTRDPCMTFLSLDNANGT